MSNMKILSLSAALGLFAASFANAEVTTDENGNRLYPASMSGVVMADVPASDLCQLDSSEVLTDAGQALVDAEILTRGLICDTLVAGLGATNLGVIIPAGTTLLLAAIANAGNTNGTTSDTQ